MPTHYYLLDDRKYEEFLHRLTVAKDIPDLKEIMHDALHYLNNRRIYQSE